MTGRVKEPNQCFLFASIDIHDSTAFRRRPRTAQKAGIDEQWLRAVQVFYERAQAAMHGSGVEPVKAIGDELWFAGEVKGSADALRIVRALANGMRVVDRSPLTLEVNEIPRLHCKGTIWLAQCPVPNVVVRPMGALDCIGPAMEAGYRLCAMAMPDWIPLSADLAWLVLGDKQAEGLVWGSSGRRVFKETLGEREYPVVCVQAGSGGVEPAPDVMPLAKSNLAATRADIEKFLVECEDSGQWLVRPSLRG